MEIYVKGTIVTFEDIIAFLEEFRHKIDCLEQSFIKIFDYRIDEEDLLEENGLVRFAVLILNNIKDTEAFEEALEEIESDRYGKTRWDLEDDIYSLEKRLEEKEEELESLWEMYYDEKGRF